MSPVRRPSLSARTERRGLRAMLALRPTPSRTTVQTLHPSHLSQMVGTSPQGSVGHYGFIQARSHPWRAPMLEAGRRRCRAAQQNRQLARPRCRYPQPDRLETPCATKPARHLRRGVQIRTRPPRYRHLYARTEATTTSTMSEWVQPAHCSVGTSRSTKANPTSTPLCLPTHC